MNFRKVLFVNIIFIIVTVLFQRTEWFLAILTVAQLIFVPLILHLLTREVHGKLERLLPYCSLIASTAVFVIPYIQGQFATISLALIYLLFTCIVALFGVKRFLNRGFFLFEEILIDLGLIYLSVGGIWFFAFHSKIDTGFSSMITWLTSVHFHYSGFLFLIFFGFLGRMLKVGKWYLLTGFIIIISPWMVALGITFSVLLEVVSVILYIVGIYSCIFLSIKAPIINKVQRAFIIISFGSLGVTILFSLAYAFGNYSNLYTIGIDDMIATHGVLNTILFAFIGLIGWIIGMPTSKEMKPNFPISKIRGKMEVGEKVLQGKIGTIPYKGLVDDMKSYQTINPETIPSIVDFYENTNAYRLFAKVNWSKWFIPFAATYRLFSKQMKQLNLPLSTRREEMEGDIIPVKDSIDGRKNVRAWIRKINGETVFVALYSEHITNGKKYMNISLPLPAATMVGVLNLSQNGKTLCLTSKRQSRDTLDSGIYLLIKKYVMKLPLEEQFEVTEFEEGKLKAKHQMWIFSLPFLKIEYDIQKKQSEDV
ncbi:YndJ family protein [Paucisalibacillus sp. EB02]|uniref:YndJ family protein n=1 Tax=Paucisalibacillus sp. EB02 TaxID=1347087 RepID=UPI0004B741FF|nr:YndJ family protein [Paucisalibacillus sp. EB02]